MQKLTNSSNETVPEWSTSAEAMSAKISEGVRFSSSDCIQLLNCLGSNSPVCWMSYTLKRATRRAWKSSLDSPSSSCETERSVFSSSSERTRTLFGSNIISMAFAAVGTKVW